MSTPAGSNLNPTYQLVFGSAVGTGPEDFYVLGYCYELDELEKAKNSAHEEFCWILRFQGGRRQIIKRLEQRLERLWLAPSGTVYGVGGPSGVLEISGQLVTETSIANLSGIFAGIWGPDENDIFAVGNSDSFMLHRKSGTWMDLALPPDVVGLWDVGGFAANEVYAVGEKGQILYFDGVQLHVLDSPTTNWLTSVAPMPDGRVCIGGYGGVLLYGNFQGWRLVDIGTDEELLSLAPFRGGVCYLTPDALWWFDGKSAPSRLYRKGGRWINAIGGALTITDNKDTWLFDGTGLTQLDTTI